MPPKFPTDRQEKRAVLLNAVEEVRDVLEAGADEAESLRTLPMSTVNALYDSGLLWLKLPAEFGGAEADLVTQLEVLEAISNIDTSAGWCTMIGASACSFPGAFLGKKPWPRCTLMVAPLGRRACSCLGEQPLLWKGGTG